MDLNDEQLRAVKIIDRNVAVNAGAGTGKTEVLTRRYLEILRNGNLVKGDEISSIVAITFTIKAANEMKERIRSILSEEEDLSLFLEDMNDAQISTIHSFCAKLIRDNSLYLDIDPNFEILEESERDRILRKTIEDIIYLNDRYFSFILDLLNLLNINDIQIIISEIINLYNKIGNTILSIESIRNITNNDIELLNKFSCIEKIREELIYIKENVKLRKNTNLFKFVNNDDNLDNLDNDEIFNILKNSCTIKNDKVEYLVELINSEIEFREFKNKNIYNLLFELLEDINHSFMLSKKKIGKFDFNDLEHFTLDLLQNDSLRKNIQNSIKYLMVDEYQDSNDIQKEIFYKICSKNEDLDINNLFVVGDPKQSIYGFRGANIHVFDDTRNDISEIGEVITFTENYRTGNKILNGIDNIYSNLMKARYTSLNPNKDLSNKIKYLNSDNKRDKDFDSRNISNFIAKEVNNDENLNFGDFTLLFRTKKDQVAYENSFTERKIPYYTFDSSGFYKSQEIILIREIMKLIKNNNNNYSIYYILKSKIYNISDEEIFNWILNGEKLIEDYVKDLNSNITVLQKEQKDSIFNFIVKIYKAFNLFELYNFEETNIQKQGNLYKLLELASEFDNSNLSYDEFLYFLIDNTNEENMKQVEDENSNVVKLMTIHGSKGLGFNNVVIPYMNKKNHTDNDLIRFNKKYGISIKMELANARYINEGFRIAEENEIENDNIYYVAMTRSKNGLILGLSGINSGYKNRIIDEIEKLEDLDLIDKIGEIEFSENRNFSDIGEEKLEEFKNIINLNNDVERDININISKVIDYYYKAEENIYNIKNNDEFKLAYSMTGNIMHRYAELYNGVDLDFENILREFNVEISQKNKFNKYIENFKNMYNFKAKEFYNEIQFLYEENNLFFSGIIDRIEIEENLVRVVDYKFSLMDEDKLKEKYWIQLVFYGIVCEKLYPDKTIELVIKNIRKNYQLKIDFNDKIKALLNEKLDNYITNI